MVSGSTADFRVVGCDGNLRERRAVRNQSVIVNVSLFTAIVLRDAVKCDAMYDLKRKIDVTGLAN